MRRLLIALFALLVLAAPADAKSRYRVGIGEQKLEMFSDSAFAPLKIKRVRYNVNWDWNRLGYTRDNLDAYLTAAHAQRIDVLVHLGASAGCWNGKRYSRAKHCKAPSRRKYARSVRTLRKKYPFVKTFGAWNEANHKSQPTYKKPKLAARYYDTLRKTCRKCTVVAADLLDSSNLFRYARKFKKRAHHKVRIWGLHNYSDVNRHRSRQTRKFLRKVRGQVWLTETGGIVNFRPQFPYSTKRAAKRTRYLFSLADRYSKKRRGTEGAHHAGLQLLVARRGKGSALRRRSGRARREAAGRLPGLQEEAQAPLALRWPGVAWNGSRVR